MGQLRSNTSELSSPECVYTYSDNFVGPESKTNRTLIQNTVLRAAEGNCSQVCAFFFLLKFHLLLMSLMYLTVTESSQFQAGREVTGLQKLKRVL